MGPLSVFRVAPIALMLSIAVCPASAQDQIPRGVVLIRVIGTLTAVLDEQPGDRRQIGEPFSVVGNGSGLIISRLGYVLTNNHVIADEEYRGEIQGKPARISLTVQRVEVFFPPDPRTGAAGTTMEASVVATDPELDVAVLAIPGNDLPYVPLGDSDVLRVGQTVSAAGYPLGETLDVSGGKGPEALVPAASGGSISALRPEADGTLRYIQTTAPLNRGNSGGPLVDRYGFAVAIIQAKVRAAEGIGFAIPINLVKTFLARNGLDTSLPATSLALGHVFDSPEKQLRFQAPSGFEDIAGTRLAVDSGSSLPGVALHVDRIASSWTLQQLEEEMKRGKAFETESTTVEPPVFEARVFRGASVVRSDGPPLRMVYSLIDKGGEKIVARYVGAAEQVGFNESVLRASLASIDASPMLNSNARLRLDTEFEPARLPVLGDVVTQIPAAWVTDGGAPLPCRGLRAPAESLVLFPPQDFSTSFRIGAYDRMADPVRAASKCGGEADEAQGDYRKRFSQFGIDYTVIGRIVRSGSRVLQVEAVAPARSSASVGALFAKWTAALGLK